MTTNSVNFRQKISVKDIFWFLRLCLIGFGFCGIVWFVFSVPVRSESAVPVGFSWRRSIEVGYYQDEKEHGKYHSVWHKLELYTAGGTDRNLQPYWPTVDPKYKYYPTKMTESYTIMFRKIDGTEEPFAVHQLFWQGADTRKDYLIRYNLLGMWLDIYERAKTRNA